MVVEKEACVRSMSDDAGSASAKDAEIEMIKARATLMVTESKLPLLNSPQSRKDDENRSFAREESIRDLRGEL